MKKLNYGSAIVSFCPDLTAPNGESIPLAGLLFGQVDDDGDDDVRLAAVAWLEIPDQIFKADPIAAKIMRDLPSVLKEHVDEAWESIVAEEDAATAAESLLAELHNSLRNSLHVSEISFAESEVQEVDDAPGVLVNLLNKRLREVVDRHPPRSRPSQPALTRRPTPPGGVYKTNVWPLPQKQSSADCHAE